MPKSNVGISLSKSSFELISQSSHDSIKAESALEAPWSDWIWWEQERIYYRGKLESETNSWKYEFTAGVDALAVRAASEQYTQADLDVEAFPEPGSTALLYSKITNLENQNEQAVEEVELRQVKSDEAVQSKEQSQKTKKDPSGRQSGATSWKQRKSRKQNYEKIVAYLEAVEREEKKKKRSRNRKYYYE